MTGVLLVNMGGPETPEELRKFLRLMFLDKHIIPASLLIREFLSFYISNTRYKKSWERYSIIGGTPLKKNTATLAELLQTSLGNTYKVKAAYSYSEPFISEALQEFVSEDILKVIAVPLYPHYSITTTASVEYDIHKTVARLPELKVRITPEFYGYVHFIEFWNDAISSHIKEQNLKDPFLLFSAHSIPLSFIKKGDSYPRAIEESAKLIAHASGNDHAVSFQSGMNPKTWLGPDTVFTIQRLAAEGKKEIVIIPVSFVSENLETLYDLDRQIVPLSRQENNIHISRVSIPEKDPVFCEIIKELVHEFDD
jgi:protoporphyrin/coproporphyrin ferrochelatase